MAEYALACVLQEQRHLRQYRQQQAHSKWISYPPRKAADTTVAVLGLGRIGLLVAQRFIDNHFNVTGWSRSLRNISGVDCYAGADGLPKALESADYVVAVLPSTPQTRGMFDLNLFKRFNPQAVFINVGRGDQVNEADLIKALDQDLLAAAILDVMSIRRMFRVSISAMPLSISQKIIDA
jgi:glyoxylate/hydroxypyruvate reductase A